MRGRALDRFDVLDPGFHDGFVGQIRSLELESVSDRSRMQRECDLFAGMKGRPVRLAEDDEGALFFHV